MIRNHILLAFALLCPLLMSNPANAAKDIETCKNKTADQMSTAAMSRCLDGVISHVDRELQTWVNLHTFNLEEKALVNGRYSALKMFKRSQSNFITYRENDCRWQYLAISPETGADLAYKTCYIMLSLSRIDGLSNIQTNYSAL
ncbi:lysozyme inhibitor LprI family protein [Colwellia piezophila]|uniref:lysozyme inhibitor LprI family protein n=1 Tax=Colwellia piezophila TaxID=211668 RepID=UPI00037CDE04|nr:lysozyme inhibitor LprI family protein [Colwellia piezophila]